MTAAVLSIGTELTRGELVNTNAAWLAEGLTELGFDVVEQVVVDDDPKRIADAVSRLASQVQVIVATGGLGPTSDDCTAAAVARALGVSLVRDPAALEAVRRRYTARGREMPPTNAKQADFPVGATVIPNPVGTAPAFSVQLASAVCYFMPGVPSEMTAIFQNSITPAIAKLALRSSHQVHLRSFGLTESEIASRLEGLEEEHPGLTLGYRASFPEIEVKVFVRATDEVEAESLARTVAAEVRARVGEAIYGGRDDAYPAVVGAALRRRGLTLSLAESCTGGLIGAMLTDVPGSSDYLLFDAVTYANSAKNRVLGVTPETLRAYGAVSAETAAAMAEGALRVSNSDIAIATTGIAGPGGGTDEKPVGTVFVAIAERGVETQTQALRLSGNREQVRVLTSYLALRMILRAALGGGGAVV